MTTSIPPNNLKSCIGLICNGEIELTDDLGDRIKQCQTLIGVDGGLNYCKHLDLKPTWIVGDYDSVEPSIYSEYSAKANCTVLPRAKDCTDLEAAIDKAKEISAYAQIVIWGALGGRLDHTLCNILLLLRNPGKIFLESQSQVLFAVSEKSGEVKISHDTSKTLTIYPINGPAKNVTIKLDDGVTTMDDFNSSSPHTIPFNKNCTLKVGAGEVIVVLDQRELQKDIFLDNRKDIVTSFALKQPVVSIFAHLAHQAANFRNVHLLSEHQRVVNIQKDSGTVIFPSQLGETISLIPFNGAAQGINTKGLKWDLHDGTLSKDAIGVSNVSTGGKFSVSVSKGQLLCIVNEDIIDEEMIGLRVYGN